ncbi:MAG: ABC transporter permease [Spirochaetales bacterium]|nr:ABC transporter permease [Spirochaetales bacterium]
MRTLIAFLRRDILTELSYSFRVLLHFGSFAMTIVFMLFISRMMGDTINTYLAKYGNNYFAYALIGMAISTFISTGLYSFSGQIRQAQVEGTLEILLLSPVSVYTILTGNSLWSFILSFLESFTLLAIVAALFPGNMGVIEALLVLATLAVTFTSFLALGMMSAAFILVFKQGNPINMIFGASSYFLGGVFFPIEVMPVQVQYFSKLLPAYHSARLVREIILVAPPDRELASSFIYLTAFTAVCAVLGTQSFRLALKTAKKNGSLIQF